MSSVRRQYPFHVIEPKWQAHWGREETFRAWNPGELVPAGHPFAVRHGVGGRCPRPGELPPKYYILDMFPYPSGAGLHVGHPEGYTATDILARYRRALGYNVLHPIGWDAFGLPAEQYAIKTGQHPRVTTNQNIATFRRQIRALGFSYDWSREIDTTHPGYFRWTQWIFLQLYQSYFDPEWNKAAPIALLEDALSDVPQCRREWKDNAFLRGTHEAFVKDIPVDQRETVRRALIENKRLAYVADVPVWWCEELGTVLANEEVIDGRSEVGGYPVARKPMRQWMLRITAYAERLLQDLDGIDWPESLKEMQRNWIGRSEGALVRFPVAGAARGERASADRGHVLEVFTTRPDTLFGATYMVLAPEHRSIDEWSEKGWIPPAWPFGTPEAWKAGAATPREAIGVYRAYAAKRSDLERSELAKEKTGVFTGVYALNPVNNEQIPVWVADYVLISYGTGAIMAVPAHDTRDLEFARKFHLPIRVVVQAPEGQDSLGYVEDGTSIDSGPITGLPTPEAKCQIIDWLETHRLGQRRVNYRIRDWLFSRQRYWGEPFPIIWKRDGTGTLRHEAVPESELPVVPPPLENYKPTPDGQPPLARATDWMQRPDGAQRETNTMPQWAGSCWYYLRYVDPRSDSALCGKETEAYWMGGERPESRTQDPASGDGRTPSVAPGVDLYVGGTEHAVLHLLYARFWHKVLYDLGHVSTPEPFFKLVNQGLILGEMEYTAFAFLEGRWCSATDLREVDEEATPEGPRLVGFHRQTGEKVYGRRVAEGEVQPSGDSFVLQADPRIRVDARSFKMSKSRGNVINPDSILAEYGADAFRLYEMFMGPLEMVKPWSTKNVDGVYRFLGRVWRLLIDEKSETEFEQQCTAEPGRAAEFLEAIRLDSTIQAEAPTSAQLKSLHACIQKVTGDLDNLRFNTAISALMIFVRDAAVWPVKPVSVLCDFLRLLHPFAPHLAEELWAKLHSAFRLPHAALAYAPWPRFDPALLVEELLEIPVQVNGRLRDRISVPAAADDETIRNCAIRAEKAQPFLAGKTIRKVIVVPKRLVNIVAA